MRKQMRSKSRSKIRSRSRPKVRSKVSRKRYTKRHTRKRSKKKTKKRRSRKLQSGGGPVDWALDHPGWVVGGILGIIALSALVVGGSRKKPREREISEIQRRIDVSAAREGSGAAHNKWKVRIPTGFVPEERGKGKEKAYYYKFKVIVPNTGTLLSGIKRLDIRGEGELDVEDRYSGFEMLRERIVEDVPALGKLEFPEKGNLQGFFDARTESARIQRGRALGTWLENSLNLLFTPVPGELASDAVEGAGEDPPENILEARSFMEDFIFSSNEKVLQELFAEDTGPESTAGTRSRAAKAAAKAAKAADAE